MARVHRKQIRTVSLVNVLEEGVLEGLQQINLVKHDFAAAEAGHEHCAVLGHELGTVRLNLLALRHLDNGRVFVDFRQQNLLDDMQQRGVRDVEVSQRVHDDGKSLELEVLRALNRLLYQQFNAPVHVLEVGKCP